METLSIIKVLLVPVAFENRVPSSHLKLQPPFVVAKRLADERLADEHGEYSMLAQLEGEDAVEASAAVAAAAMFAV